MNRPGRTIAIAGWPFTALETALGIAFGGLVGTALAIFQKRRQAEEARRGHLQ